MSSGFCLLRAILAVSRSSTPHKHRRQMSRKQQGAQLRKRSRQFLWPVLLLTALLAVACNRPTPTPPPSPTATPAGFSLPTEPPVLTVPTADAQTPAAPGTATEQPAAQTAQPTAPTATPAPPADAGTVVLWHSWTGPSADALAEILGRFRQENPQIEVETLFVGYADLPQVYAAAVAAGAGPDLMLAPNWWLQDLAGADVLLPLADKLPPGLRTQFVPAAIENLSFDGVLYGLPTNYELVALYYNRRLISEENLPATTADLLALAQADPAQGAGIYTNFYHLFWGIPAYGGALFDDDGRVILDQTPGAAEFLDWLIQADDTPGIFVDLDYGMLIDRFKKEEFAFFIDGPWSAEELQNALGDGLAVMPLPAGPAGPARPWLSADGVFLNPAVAPAQQQLALQLAVHLTSAESASLLAQRAGQLPAHLAADPGDDPLVAGFMAQGMTAIPEPHRPEMVEVWGYAGDMLVKALNRVASPQDAVLEAATLINEANGK